MVKKRKVELYEILSGRQPEDGQQPAGSLYPQQIPGQLSEFSRKRTGREVVFSLNGAFVIFVAFLIIIGTVYNIGYNKGVLDEKKSFQVNENITRNLDAESIELSAIVNVTPYSSVKIEPGQYTLKLLSFTRSNGNLRKLKAIREKLLAVPMVENSRIDALVFDNPGNKTYTLGLGVFKRSDSTVLDVLRKQIKEDPPQVLGNSQLEVSVERVDDLGKPIL